MKKNNRKNNIQTLSLTSPFFVIVLACLIVQMLNQYHAIFFKAGLHFYYGYVVTCFIIPLIILLIFQIPFSQLGLGLPKFDKKTGKFLLILAIALLVVFLVAQFFQVFFFHEYTNKFTALNSHKLSRFYNFLIFTGSTLPSWEFLHRAFLLFGMIYVLTKQARIPEDLAQKISITIVWIFEVIFHFTKPEYEALAMLVGSPVLSYMAIKTRSIWTAFIMHLYVELLFISAIIFK